MTTAHAHRIANDSPFCEARDLMEWPRTIADVLHGLHDRKQRDATRSRPVNKRVWASIDHPGQQVIDDAFAEALRRDPERQRRWVVLVDGDRDQIRRVLRGANKAGTTVTIVLDLVHVIEYLWRAAYAFHADGTVEAEQWVEDRLLALLRGRSAGEIAKSLRGMIVRHGLDAKAARPVVKCANYLVKNTRWLHYDRALADGLPIATGVIEGACRHLVQDRMGRTGGKEPHPYRIRTGSGFSRIAKMTLGDIGISGLTAIGA